MGEMHKGLFYYSYLFYFHMYTCSANNISLLKSWKPKSLNNK